MILSVGKDSQRSDEKGTPLLNIASARLDRFAVVASLHRSGVRQGGRPRANPDHGRSFIHHDPSRL